MDGVVLIGDELAAAAFALAGVEAHAVAPAEAPACFERALRDAGLVVLMPAHAAALDAQRLRAAVAHASPPVVVMPDLVAPRADAGFVRRMRVVLGIEG